MYLNEEVSGCNVITFLQCLLYNKSNCANIEKYVALAKALNIVKFVKNPAIKKALARENHDKEHDQYDEKYWFFIEYVTLPGKDS